MGVLAVEIMARTGRDPAEHYRDLTRELGEPVYERIAAEATPEEKSMFERLSAVAGAPRPSGTEAVYKLYAESFKGPDHLHRIQEQAQAVIQKVFRTRAAR